MDIGLQAGRKIGEWYIAEAMFSTTTVVRTAQDMSTYICLNVRVLDHKHNFMVLDLLDFGWRGGVTGIC